MRGGSPWVPVSKARAAATEAIAELSKALISSLSDREELGPILPMRGEADDMGVVVYIDNNNYSQYEQYIMHYLQYRGHGLHNAGCCRHNHRGGRRGLPVLAALTHHGGGGCMHNCRPCALQYKHSNEKLNVLGDELVLSEQSTTSSVLFTMFTHLLNLIVLRTLT